MCAYLHWVLGLECNLHILFHHVHTPTWEVEIMTLPKDPPLFKSASIVQLLSDSIRYKLQIGD